MSKTIYPIIAEPDELPLYPGCISSRDSMRAVGFPKGDELHTFLFTAGGEGIVSSGGEEYRLSRGDFIFIPAGTPYSLTPEGADWAADMLTVGGSSAGAILGQLGFDGVKLTKGADTEHCERLFEQLAAAAERTIPDTDIVSSLLYAFLLAVHKAVKLLGTVTYSGSIGSSVEHIDRHYGEEITLERLAQISGVSLQHFCRVFRSQLGMRPMEYLARRRVAEAKILLGETDDRIGDIAKAVGFEDQNYFGITFRKYEGVSPTEYRRERGMTEKNPRGGDDA